MSVNSRVVLTAGFGGLLYVSGTYVRDYLLEPEIGKAESYRTARS